MKDATSGAFDDRYIQKREILPKNWKVRLSVCLSLTVTKENYVVSLEDGFSNLGRNNHRAKEGLTQNYIILKKLPLGKT